MRHEFPKHTATREGLNFRIESAAPHIRPLLIAVRDLGIRLAFISHVTEGPRIPFKIPDDRPAVVFLGDDFDTAMGPAGFHKASLKRVLRSVCGAVVVSCEPLPQAYVSAAMSAGVMGRHALLVETRPEQEIPWLALIQKARPGLPILCATVRGGTA